MTEPSPLARWITDPLRAVRVPRDRIYTAKAFAARLWPPWVSRKELTDAFDALWNYSLSQGEATTESLIRLGDRMTSNEDAAYARAAEVVGLIRAEFESLRGQVAAAVQDKDAAVAAGVQSALNEDSAADAERIGGLISELESVLPAQVPDVPVPAPGEAAEVPADEQPGGDAA